RRSWPATRSRWSLAPSSGRTTTSTSPSENVTSSMSTLHHRAASRACPGRANQGAPSRSRPGGQPWARLAGAPRDLDELVGAHLEPRPMLAVGPLDADPGAGCRAEPEVDPAELAAGMATADRDLAPERRVPEPDLDPGADRVAVRTRLGEADRQ